MYSTTTALLTYVLMSYLCKTSSHGAVRQGESAEKVDASRAKGTGDQKFMRLGSRYRQKPANKIAGTVNTW